MKARKIGRIVIITTVLAAFVLYLCASVSKLTPIPLIVALCAAAVALEALLNSNFTAVKLFIQKRE